MSKIHIIGHRQSLDETLESIQTLGVVHLIDVSSDTTVTLPPLSLDDAHRREVEELRYLRARIEGLLALVGDLRPAARDERAHLDLDEVRTSLTEVGPQVERLVERLDELTIERDTLPRHIATLRSLLPLTSALTDLESYDTAAVILDARHADVLGDLNLRLGELLGGNFEILSDRIGPDTVGAIVIFPKKAKHDVDVLFGAEQVSRVRLPGEYQNVPFRQAIGAMERRLEAVPAEIARVRDEIADMVVQRSDWATASLRISDRLAQLEAVRRMGATPHTFVISGWVPTGRVEALSQYLSEAVGEDVLVESVPPSPNDEPPVLLGNPAPARPFESLIRLLALPRPGSIDPTMLMALFLPLFFGMMLGDVAYGLVIVVAASIAVRRLRSSTGKDIARVMVMAGAWSTLWGVVYGEFLGDLGRSMWGWQPLWIDRETALEPLLLFALAVGGAHVMLGVILGIIQATRGRDAHTAIGRGATLVALIGLFLAAGTIAGLLPDGVMTPAVAAVVVGLVIVIVAGGPMGLLMGPLEFMGILGNILSYLRIAAIGLASVYLARVANELGATGPVWMGVIVATLFHALNLVLGAFSPAIQALRLHYVEFFGRFYDEGGRQYRPFGRADLSTSITHR